MRRFLALSTILLLAMVLVWAYVLMRSAERPPEPIHNAYWPFTVELSVRDK